jgi:hypothetical protein
MFKIEHKQAPSSFEAGNMYVVQNRKTLELETVLVTSFFIENQDDGCIYMHDDGDMSYSSATWLNANYILIKKVNKIILE